LYLFISIKLEGHSRRKGLLISQRTFFIYLKIKSERCSRRILLLINQRKLVLFIYFN